LLFVEDIRLVQQTCTWAHVAFDDVAVADFFDEQVDAGRRPEQFSRIWIHTHPGNCPQPSGVDETTFARVFGQSSWAIMFILACGGRSWARLRLNSGPGAELEIANEVSYASPFAAGDHDAWEQEYSANVQQEEPQLPGAVATPDAITSLEERLAWMRQDDWIDYLEQEEHLRSSRYEDNDFATR
jgi:hypothetical protein